MPAQSYDYHFKILVVGEAKVGKSCLIRRYGFNEFSDDYNYTIGLETIARTVEVDNRVISHHVWDTSGQERFRSNTTCFFRGAYGVIIVYDVTNQESLNQVQNWYARCLKYCLENVPIILVGNKCDLTSNVVVDYPSGKAVADELGIPFIQTSAKDPINVDQLFVAMTSLIKDRHEQQRGPHIEQPLRLTHFEAVNIFKTKCCV